MTERVFLPSIHNNAPVAAQGEPRMSFLAQLFAVAWMKALGERRELMTVSGTLVGVAQEHADFLANRVDTQPSMHIGRNGSTPNIRVRASGYKLLSWHLDGNTVESCTRTWENLTQGVHENMVGIVASLMAHEAHHDHMWGIGWYEPSTVYGVGAASEPTGSMYFVVDCCPPPEAI